MLRHLTNGIALALFVCLAIGFGFLEGASYKAQQSIHSDQRAAHDQKESGPEAPSFAPIRLIFGSDGVAKYCDASTENNKRNWAHKYICDIRITDVYIALFTLLLTFVTGG